MKNLIIGLLVVASAVTAGLAYDAPEGSVTVPVIAACPATELAAAGFDYVSTKNGYGMVTNVYYTKFNAKLTTNSTHGVTSSVIAMYANHVTGNAADGTILVHGNSAKTNVIAVIHR